MTPSASAWADALLRWAHVLAGILWLGGHLYVLHGSTSRAAKAPDLGGRAVQWLRWGAIYTWATGFLLTALAYYATNRLVRNEVRLVPRHGFTTGFTLATNEPVVSPEVGVALSVAAMAAAFFVYDGVWRLLGRHGRSAAAAVSFALYALSLFLLSHFFTGRGVFIHAGAILGTAMAMNVWVRIWPAQRRIDQAKGGPADPDSSAWALVAERSRHNLYMSVPLAFAMVSNHYPSIYDGRHGWAVMAGITLLGWALTRWLLGRGEGAVAGLGTAGGPQPGDPAASKA